MTYVTFLGGIAVAFWLVVRAISRGALWIRPIQYFVMDLPGVGKALQTLALARLAWSMHVTMNAGMDVRRALRLSLSSTQRRYTDHIPVIDDEISPGNSLAGRVSQARRLPAEFLDTLAVAEESGRVVESMGILVAAVSRAGQGAIAILTMLAGWAVWFLIAVIILHDLPRVRFYIKPHQQSHRTGTTAGIEDPRADSCRFNPDVTPAQSQAKGNLPKMQTRRFLVTGGAGFIGSHIAEALVRRGDRVRVLDNLCTGHLANMDSFRDRIEFIEGDVTDAAAVARAVDGVDCVFHEAALASVPLSVERPLDSNAACVTGTVAGARRRAAGGRCARGLRRVERRLRRPADEQQTRERSARPAFALRRGQSWPANSIARRFGRASGSRRSPSATSTSSARDRIRTASTRP